MGQPLADAEQTIRCPRDSQAMRQETTVLSPTGDVQMRFFICPQCQMKAALMYEIIAGALAKQESWVEDEVRRRGSFFPSDYTGGGDF